MKAETFLAEKISFDDINDINAPALALNSVGNFLLSPARHLFHGRSVRCVFVKHDNESPKAPVFDFEDIIKDKPPEGIERVCKTIASVIFFIPGVLLGSAIKGLSMLTSDRLKQRYNILEQYKQGNYIFKESTVFSEKSKPEKTTDQRSVTFEQLKGYINAKDIGFNELDQSVKSKFHSLFSDKQYDLFQGTTANQASFIAGELSQILQNSAENSSIDELKQKLKAQWKVKNAEQEDISRDEFGKILGKKFGKIPDYIFNSPEWKSLKKSFQSNTWPENGTMSYTITHVEQKNYATVDAIIDAAFEDEDLKLVFERFIAGD